MNKEIKEIVDELGTTFEQFKQANDALLKAKADGTAFDDLDEKVTKLNASLSSLTEKRDSVDTKFASLQERLEELEAKSSLPGRTGEGAKLEHEHVQKFVGFIRSGASDFTLRKECNTLYIKTLATKYGVPEAKVVQTVTDPEGGAAVPEVISRDIEVLEKKLSPVRNIVKVVTVGTSDYKELVNIRGHAAAWVGEAGTRSETATSSLRTVTPTMGELYAYPKASEWSLDDMFFDVAAWLRDESAEEFAIAEGIAVLSGDGTDKATGILNTTPTTAVDFASPLRAAAVIQFVGTQPSPSALPVDDLITLRYALNRRYLNGAVWTMNNTTTSVIRKLKGSDNNYLWEPGLRGDHPDRLLGFPVETWEDMADVGNDAFPILFGNFRRGYVMVDRVGMRITRDDVTTPGFVKFYIRRREGGIVLNNDAIKALRT